MRLMSSWYVVAAFGCVLANTTAFAEMPVTQRDILGPHLEPGTAPPDAVDAQRVQDGGEVQHWNRVALEAVGRDHSAVAPGEVPIFGQQLGPARTARALAIVHIAMFEALNAIHGTYQSYTGGVDRQPGAHGDAAVAQAAHDALASVYSAQASIFDTELNASLASATGSQVVIARGRAVGRQAAGAILALRSNDGSLRPEPRIGVGYTLNPAVGHWRPDPITQSPVAVGAFWGQVKPFVIQSSSQFRAPPPPALTSADYAAAFAEVKRLGGDGVTTPTERTADQTQIGIFWSYDGTPKLGTPPRLYNQITMLIAAKMATTDLALARLLALVNTALADTAIAVWESKYTFDFWRPVSGIREAANDANPLTSPDATFTPLGAQATNLSGPNFTPPFPAYPSGHSGFGSALFEILRSFYGRDNIAFTFVSDELNGISRDNHGAPRALAPRTFSSLSQAEEENGQSRIYLGVHWAFDKTAGAQQGRAVADFVLQHAFLPGH